VGNTWDARVTPLGSDCCVSNLFTRFRRQKTKAAGGRGLVEGLRPGEVAWQCRLHHLARFVHPVAAGQDPQRPLLVGGHAHEALGERPIKIIAGLLDSGEAVDLGTMQLCDLPTEIVLQDFRVIAVAFGGFLLEQVAHLLGPLLIRIARLRALRQFGQRDAVARDVGLPLLLGRFEMGRDRGQLLLCLGERGVEFGQPGMLLGRGHDHPVTHSANARLGDVGEERAEQIKDAGRDRAELGNATRTRWVDRRNTRMISSRWDSRIARNAACGVGTARGATSHPRIPRSP